MTRNREQGGGLGCGYMTYATVAGGLAGVGGEYLLHQVSPSLFAWNMDTAISAGVTGVIAGAICGIGLAAMSKR